MLSWRGLDRGGGERGHWGVGPVTKARLTEIGVYTIGQLAEMPGGSLERLLGRAAGEKLTALAWNRDPRELNYPRLEGEGFKWGRFEIDHRPRGQAPPLAH